MSERSFSDVAETQLFLPMLGRPQRDLEAGELFLSERRYLTYRRRRWKSYLHRRSGRHALVDLRNDPRETQDAAAEYPRIVSEHRARMEELASELAGEPDAGRTRSERDRARLKALGYSASEQ